MMNEIVSVIIPAYNVPEKLISRCVTSICSQKYSCLEIIIVDDGSGEKYSAILNYLADFDSRVKVVRQSNQGASSARNTGLKIASGKWILFIDSDDWIEPNAIYDGMCELYKKNADLFIMGHVEETFDGKNGIKRCASMSVVSAADRRSIAELDANFQLFSCWGKIYRRSLICNCQFPVDMSWGENTAFVYEILKENDSRIIVSSDALYHYDVGAQTKKQSTSFKFSRVHDLDKLCNIYLSFYQKNDFKVQDYVYTKITNFMILMMRTTLGGGC